MTGALALSSSQTVASVGNICKSIPDFAPLIRATRLIFRNHPLTIVPLIVTCVPIPFTEGPFARVLSEVERERFLRAGLRPAPGRLRASFTPVLRPVREVQSLDWDR